MADFNFFLNRQGIQGRKGEKGDTGFSPTISVGTDTLDEYKLIIANESNSFETPNLRGNINIQDNGGTYLRYDTETKQISAQSMDAATADTVGGVRLSTEADIVEMGAGSVVTPSDVADALPLYLEGEGAVTITQDELTSKTKIKVDVPSVNDLESRMSTAEAEIADIQTDVANLNNNKVSKTDLATTESAGIVKVDGTSITVTADGTISASPSGTLPIASTTQLGGVKVDGTSIIADENGVISSVGGGGTGDVTASGNNTFTGNNKFKKNVTIDCDPSSGNALILRDSWADPYTNYATLRMDNSGDLTINSEAGGLILDTYLHKSKIEMNKNGNIWFTSEKPLMHRNFQGSGTDVPLVNQANIKAGENITLNKNAETGDITISSTASGGGGGDVPIATTETAGKVKPDGTTITVTDDGTISAVPTTPTNVVTTDTTQKIAARKEFDTYDYPLIFYGNKNQDMSSSGSSFLQIQNNHIYQKEAGGNPIEYVRQHISAGEGISLSANDEKVTISATGGGGGSAPDNMVTTDTAQDITGKKTIVNSDGLCFKSTNSLATSVTAQIVNTSSSVPNTIGKVTISPNKSSGSRNGFARISYGILNDGNSSSPLYGKGGLQVTPVVDDTSAEARILLGNVHNGMGNIVGTTSGLTIGTGAVGSELSITSTDITFNGQSLLNSGGETPANMVTTDTSQTISGAKTFTEPTVFKNTLNMSTANTDTLYIYASGSYAQGYTTDIKYHKNLNIKSSLSGGAITLAPNNGSLNALKYKNSDGTDNPSYDILHTGNLVAGNNITISEPNSTGIRTISGPSNEYMASMALPSNRYVNLTLGASGANYTAPADGYVSFLQKLSKGNNTQLPSFNIGVNGDTRPGFGCNRVGTSLGAATIRGFVPVRKGDSFYISYVLLDTSYTGAQLKFHYAEGVPSA